MESILPEIWLIGKGRFFFNSSNSSTKVEALQVALERRFNCNTKLKRYLRHAKLTLKNATPFLLSWLPPGWIFHQYEAFPNRPSEKDEFGNADLVDRKNYKNRALQKAKIEAFDLYASYWNIKNEERFWSWKIKFGKTEKKPLSGKVTKHDIRDVKLNTLTISFQFPSIFMTCHD